MFLDKVCDSDTECLDCDKKGCKLLAANLSFDFQNGDRIQNPKRGLLETKSNFDLSYQKSC